MKALLPIGSIDRRSRPKGSPISKSPHSVLYTKGSELEGKQQKGRELEGKQQRGRELQGKQQKDRELEG